MPEQKDIEGKTFGVLACACHTHKFYLRMRRSREAFAAVCSCESCKSESFQLLQYERKDGPALVADSDKNDMPWYGRASIRSSRSDPEKIIVTYHTQVTH